MSKEIKKTQVTINTENFLKNENQIGFRLHARRFIRRLNMLSRIKKRPQSFQQIAGMYYPEIPNYLAVEEIKRKNAGDMVIVYDPKNKRHVDYVKKEQVLAEDRFRAALPSEFTDQTKIPSWMNQTDNPDL